MEAIQELSAAKGTTLLRVTGRPYLRLIRVGKGMLVLDRRSPDASGNSNLHLAAFQKAWVEQMDVLGLTPGVKPAAGVLQEVQGEDLEAWFVGEAR
jgi:hypothetical protein